MIVMPMQMMLVYWLQTTQPTSGGAPTADTTCCANCVEPHHPHQWGGHIYHFLASRPCRPAGWLALLLIKAGDVQTNINKYMLGNRYPSIRCNIIEHWMHLRCAVICKAQHTSLHCLCVVFALSLRCLSVVLALS